MKMEIELNEERIVEIAEQMVADNIVKSHSDRIYWETRKGIEKGIKEYIYCQKDKIIEMVVNRASTEIVKKGLPKLLEKMTEGDKK